MDRQLKQRVVGAAVLVALGVIFIPLLLDQGRLETSSPELPSVPPAPSVVAEATMDLPPIDDAEIEALEQLSEQRVEIPAPDTAVPDAPEAALPPAPDAPPAPPPTAPGTAADTRPATAPPSSPAPAEQPAPAPPPEPAKTPAPVPPPPKQAPAARTPAASPAVPAVPAVTSGWLVQVGSFSQSANAVRLGESLREAGFPAFVETRHEQSGAAYKVRVGPRPDRAAAEALRAELARRFGLSGILLHQP